MNTLLTALTAAALCLVPAVSSLAGMTGRIVIAGHGPELPLMQDLGRAFEKAHPGTAIDFQWDRTVKALDLVKAGEAQVAVTDRPDPALQTILVAWDGIAIIVNFANPVGQVTTAQVRDLFTGKISRWSDLEGANETVEVLPRTPTANIQSGLESSLGIAGQFHASGKAVHTDERALRTVSGRDRAISYLSMAAALKAQEDGIPIRILTVDNVEPGQPTVKSGAYKLRRPVLFSTIPHPDALTEAFVEFARSAEGQKLLQATFVSYSAGSFDGMAPPTRQTDGPTLSPKTPPSVSAPAPTRASLRSKQLREPVILSIG